MNNRAINVLYPPAIEPVSLAEGKLHARVEIEEDDLLVTSLISAAREYCETATSRAFITQTIELTLDGFPYGGGYFNRFNRENPTIYNFLPTHQGIIELPRPPFQSIVSIEYLESSGASYYMLDESVYKVVGGGKGSEQAAKLTTQNNQIWPTVYPTMGAVTITFKAGYGDSPADVPEGIKSSMKLLISHWYNNRDAVVGGPANKLPMGVDALLAPYQYGSY